MQPIGQQCHRAVDDTRQNFPDHHRQGQAYHDERSRLPGSLVILAEDVLVLPVIESMVMHRAPTWLEDRGFPQGVMLTPPYLSRHSDSAFEGCLSHLWQDFHAG